MSQTEENLLEINRMTREEMMNLWCSAQTNHPFFAYGSQEWEHFNRRFREFGGFGAKNAKKTGLEE